MPGRPASDLISGGVTSEDGCYGGGEGDDMDMCTKMEVKTGSGLDVRCVAGCHASGGAAYA